MESDPVIQFQPFISCICLKYNRFENIFGTVMFLLHTRSLC